MQHSAVLFYSFQANCRESNVGAQHVMSNSTLKYTQHSETNKQKKGKQNQQKILLIISVFTLFFQNIIKSLKNFPYSFVFIYFWLITNLRNDCKETAVETINVSIYLGYCCCLHGHGRKSRALFLVVGMQLKNKISKPFAVPELLQSAVY